MRRRGLLPWIALACLLLGATPALGGDAGDGWFKVVSDGTGSTEEEARRQACLLALRTAAGSHVFTVTQTQEMQDVWTRVAEFTDGYVVDSRLLDEPKCGNGLCRVRLEVTVALGPLETDLRRLSEMIGDPAVHVASAEPARASTEARRALESRLTQMGIRPAATTAQDIELVVDTDIALIEDTGVYIANVHLTVAVFEVSTNSLLTTLSARGRGNSTFDEIDAERKGVRSAVDSLADDLKDDLVAAWYDFLKNGQIFRVVYHNEGRVPETLPAVRGAIQLVPGLRSINERSLTEDEAVLDVRFEGLAGELMTYLRGPLRKHNLQVVRMVRRRLEIEPTR